jgi:hypothetical protein
MSYMPARPEADGLPERLPAGFPGPLPGRLLGIDAGGSATRAVVVEDGQVVRRLAAPPMNALLTPALPDRLLERRRDRPARAPLGSGGGCAGR